MEDKTKERIPGNPREVLREAGGTPMATKTPVNQILDRLVTHTAMIFVEGAEASFPSKTTRVCCPLQVHSSLRYVKDRHRWGLHMSPVDSYQVAFSVNLEPGKCTKQGSK